MLLIALRDALWRWRRFLVALIATAVVLALTLVLDGVERSFPNEVRRTVAAFDAGSWVVPSGATGVFMSSATLPADVAATVAAVPGAGAVAPVAVVRATTSDGEEVNAVGVMPGAFTDPPVEEGRAPAGPAEATAERGMGYDVGETIVIGGSSFTVVGLTSGLTFRAGVPLVYLPLADAQALGYAGQPLASAILTAGRLQAAPTGLVALDDDAVRDDMLAPLENARSTIKLVSALLWVVAAMVIGSVIYLTSLDRARDFAVLKATGSTNAALVGGLALQALLLTGAAAVVGSGLSVVLAPAMPMRAEIAGSSYIAVFIVALLVAAVASGVSVRRALRTDPALAFAGA